MKNLFLTIINLIICSNISFSQKVVAEIGDDGALIESMKGNIYGDSVFINYRSLKYINSAIWTPRALWILPDGSQQPMNWRNLNGKEFMGVVNREDSCNYYFLEEDKKFFTIHKAVNKEDPFDEKKSLKIQSNLIGYYFNKDLYLVCSQKGEFGLKIIQVRDLRVIKESSFKLSFDIPLNKKEKAISVKAGTSIGYKDALSPRKIIWSDSTLLFIIDDPSGLHNEQQTSFRTTVVKLNLDANTSVANFFHEKSAANFRSIFYENKVLRFVQRADPEFAVYDFETGRLLKKIILKNDDLTEFYLKFEDNHIEKRTSMKNITIYHSLITVDLNNSKPIIVLGGYGKVFKLGRTLLAMQSPLLSLATGGNAQGDQLIYQYAYFDLTENLDLNQVKNSVLRRQSIDDFEISEGEKEYSGKDYLHHKGKTYGFYHESKSKKMTVRKFEN